MTARIDNAAPPLPSPSIRVSTTPLTPILSSNSVATLTASCPVKPSTTKSVSLGLATSLTAVRDVANPRETLLVVDGLTGQDAVNVATEFDDKIGVSGVVLTRMDGDGRGGAALSMRAVTGKPIRFVGVGEKIDALETFEPERVAGQQPSQVQMFREHLFFRQHQQIVLVCQ